MAGSTQLATIAAKIETTLGTDAVPTNTTDAVAIRVSNLAVNIEEKFASRDMVLGFFSGPDQIPYARVGTISFSVDLQASGTLGTAPGWGKLLQGCGFSEAVTATTRVDYTPASSALKGLSIYAWVNNRLEKFVGCMGTFKTSLKIGEAPTLDFTFTGLVSSTAANAPVVPTLTAYLRPEAIGLVATTAVSIGAVTYSAGAITGGTAYNFESVDIDIANDVQYLELVGASSVNIFNRVPTASIVGDLGGTAHAAFKADMHAGTSRAFGVVHGSAAGKKVGIYAATGILTGVSDQVNGNVMYDKLDMNLKPSAAGNDELRIFCV